MSVYVECCVLSGRDLCDGPITRPEKSYRLRCVVVCDQETSRIRGPWPALGRRATEVGGVTNMLVAVVARSKAQVFGHTIVEIVGLNPTGAMDVCVL